MNESEEETRNHFLEQFVVKGSAITSYFEPIKACSSQCEGASTKG